MNGATPALGGPPTTCYGGVLSCHTAEPNYRYWHDCSMPPLTDSQIIPNKEGDGVSPPNY